jgi:hypothetical protein
MAKCVRCHKRKAKRHCPGLGGGLCPLCCGQHRNRDISCPAGCPFLTQQAEGREQDIFQDERLVWLAYTIEMTLRALAEKYADFTDRRAVRALEYASDKILRSRRLIILPGEIVQAGNDAGEAVFQAMDKCRFERRIVLPGSQTAYAQEEKLKVLERILTAVRSNLKDSIDGRIFLDQLVAGHRRAEEMSRP